jgi:hypothetical protein
MFIKPLHQCDGVRIVKAMGQPFPLSDIGRKLMCLLVVKQLKGMFNRTKEDIAGPQLSIP